MPDPGFPVFDADNHLYESPEMLTEYLPKQHRRDIQFVRCTGAPRIAVKGKITEYMPNPTFERSPRRAPTSTSTGAPTPEGKSLREMTGTADRLPSRVPGAGAAARAARRAPRPSGTDVPDAREPARVHARRRSRPHPRRRPRGQPVAARRVDLRLPGAHLHRARDHAADRRGSGQGARVGAGARREGGADPARAVTGLHGSRSFALPEFDPFWARVQEAEMPVCMHASFPPLTSYYEKWEPGRSDTAFTPTPLREPLLQHREVEDALAAMVCQGALSRSPTSRSSAWRTAATGSATCSTSSTWPTGGCRRASTNIRWRHSGATCT